MHRGRLEMRFDNFFIFARKIVNIIYDFMECLKNHPQVHFGFDNDIF